MSLLIGPDTTFIMMKSEFAIMAGHLHLLVWEVFLLIGPDTVLTRMGSVLLIGPDTLFTGMGSILAKRARH